MAGTEGESNYQSYAQRKANFQLDLLEKKMDSRLGQSDKDKLLKLGVSAVNADAQDMALFNIPGGDAPSMNVIAYLRQLNRRLRNDKRGEVYQAAIMALQPLVKELEGLAMPKTNEVYQRVKSLI